jgi:predicted HTH domain antitoxin
MTRAPVVAAAVLAVFGLAYLLWKRRRRRTPAAPKTVRERLDRNLETATSLYRSLEGALVLNGISRPASLPPLRHAEELRARSHPLADEVVALTTVYLEARFGGEALTDDTRRDYERRVREIRAYRRRDTAQEDPRRSRGEACDVRDVRRSKASRCDVARARRAASSPALAGRRDQAASFAFSRIWTVD